MAIHPTSRQQAAPPGRGLVPSSHFAGLAPDYDRLRPLGAGGARRAAMLLDRCPVPAGGAVLEVGCGSGRLLELVARLARAATALGVDPEPAMLARSARRGLEVRPGAAEGLPLPSGSVDLAYMHLAHHLARDPAAAARELARVIRPAAHAAVWSLTPEHVEAFHLNSYFPSLPGVDLARFAAPEAIARDLLEARLEPVLEQELVVRRRTTKRRLAAAVHARYISTLALIPPEELEAGAERLSREAALDPRGQVVYEQRWCLVWGRRPTGRGRLSGGPSPPGSWPPATRRPRPPVRSSAPAGDRPRRPPPSPG
ncbi:MAG: class I SAM-dependent methyltransferase [Candidatus Dormibacterales bacterium]